jgi:hypothetical protein
MSVGLMDAIRHNWEYYRERPFGRLVQLFTARIFRGGGDSDTEGLDLGVGLVLTFLAMPGGFVSLLLLNKYASFLQWLRGMTNVDALGETFPDEYFFIVLSMTVTGAAAVWRWDAIFPDRRDYINLVPLPISTRTIFFTNLIAVLFLAGLIAVDVNAVSCVLFPAVVAATQTKFSFFVKFAAVHAASVLLASIFSFFAVFSVLGLLMAVLPPRAFQRASAYIRGLVVIYLVTLLCSSSFVPSLLHRAKGSAPLWTFLLPSCWFLGLCQLLHSRGTPALTELARLVAPGTLAVVLVALGTYAIGYRRHFVRIAEIAEAPAAIRAPRRSFLGTVLRRLWLRSPFQKACFGFVWKTLLRSEAHRLVLTAVGGLGLVLASQALLGAFADSSSVREAFLSPDALAVPFILTFLIIVGLRVVFEVPAELRSNWIFQLMLDPDQEECAPLARKVILSAVLPLALVVAFPAYAFLEGITRATLHTLLVVTWTVLLTNLMLIRFRKLPFTCTFPVFKQHSIVILLAFCFGYLIYAVSIPEFEALALREPVRLLELLPVALVAWYIPHHFARNATEIERKLIFEESPARTIELLRLSE